MFVAEKNIAIVRFAVIVFNIAAYWSLLYPQGVPALAAAISVVALAYAFYVIFGQPYRRFPVLMTSVYTATTDGVLILLWIHATGDYHSPFHLLWYLSLMAVTFRYDWRAILVTSIVYAAAYAVLLWMTGTLAGHEVEVAIRAGYLLLMGTLGSLLAREALQLFEERFRLRERMQRMELERLQEMDRFKTDFINMAAHELNTPMTPLLLQVRLLRMKQAGQAIEADNGRIVDVLDRNLKRLSRLVQDMLDVARLQGGRLHLDVKPTDLRPLLAEVADTFSQEAVERGVALTVEAPPTLPAAADDARVAQVLHNLVSNAIKFTPAGGQVTVAGNVQDDHVLISVTDTGVGLSPDQAQQLFQPFSRVHRDEHKAPGTGLGLYISRGLVEWHGGTLAVESAGPGAGSRFTVRLPVRPAA